MGAEANKRNIDLKEFGPVALVGIPTSRLAGNIRSAALLVSGRDSKASARFMNVKRPDPDQYSL